MKYLNLKIQDLKSPEYIGSHPVARATWVNLLAYSADQESGGIIRNCRDWSNRRWQQTCGVTRPEVLRDSSLWSWRGGDLILMFYPLDQEREVQAKQRAGRTTAQKRWGVPSAAETHLKGANVSSSATCSATGSVDAEVNGTEENVNQIKESTHEEVRIPSVLDCPEFRSEWTRWLEYRRQQGLAPLTPFTVQNQLDELAALGAVRAAEAIRHSIARGWKSVFPPKRSASCEAAAPLTPDCPRYDDDVLIVLARENASRLADLVAKWDAIRRQAVRLGIIKNAA